MHLYILAFKQQETNKLKLKYKLNQLTGVYNVLRAVHGGEVFRNGVVSLRFYSKCVADFFLLRLTFFKLGKL